MELSRESIERADFPRTADGLDPEAVAEHLKQVAEEVERLSRDAKGSGADRVSRVVAAAEAAAAELEESAREDADRTRAEAAQELTRARDTLAGLAERAGALESQLAELTQAASAALTELTDAPRAGASAVAKPKPAPKPAPKARAKPKPPPEPKPPPTPPATAEEPAEAAVNGQPVAPGEAPRLIALNMALNGASREEISSYLAENFDLDDPGGLLDEVWARVNG